MSHQKRTFQRPPKAKGNVFTLTKIGEEALSEMVKEGLSKTRENNPLFNLALSGLDILSKDEVIACLSKRIKFLESEAERLRGKINSDILRSGFFLTE
ncbi:MAG: hypothetical protein R2883_00420 [Caldisericia bacterium]